MAILVNTSLQRDSAHEFALCPRAPLNDLG